MLLINLCGTSRILRDVFVKKADGKPFGPRDLVISSEDTMR